MQHNNVSPKTSRQDIHKELDAKTQEITSRIYAIFNKSKPHPLIFTKILDVHVSDAKIADADYDPLKTEQKLIAVITAWIEENKENFTNGQYPTTPLQIKKWKTLNEIRDALQQTILTPIPISHNLQQRKLDPQLFKKKDITLDHNIDQHARWLFENIYSKPYPNSDNPSGISRPLHGIQHVGRTAIYSSVFANLYRKYGDQEALKLSEEDMKLIQISMLFHDSARLADGKDEWDMQSATFLYLYLTGVLDVPHEKAKLLSEAVNNKDQQGEKHLVIHEANEENITWREEKKEEKNIYQKLMHDADSLDIIRARAQFEARYLDFKKNPHTQAQQELAKLIREARSFIDLVGDNYFSQEVTTKKQFERADGFIKMIEAIESTQINDYTLLKHFYNGGKTLSASELEKPLLPKHTYDPKKLMVDRNNLEAAHREGKIFFRGITMPSAKREKIGRKSESLADINVRKTLRRKGVATRTNKPDKYDKDGNINRSVSMLGNGAPVFTCVGYAVINPALDDISHISTQNSNTGYGKKKNLKPTAMTTEEKKNKLDEMLEVIKMGEPLKNSKYQSTHTEIIFNMKENHAVVYTPDYTKNTGKPAHQNAPLLQAIFLQKAHQIQTGIDIPLIEYSGTHDRIKHKGTLSEEELINTWSVTCADYLKNLMDKIDAQRSIASNEIVEHYEAEFLAMSNDAIKTLAVYNTMEYRAPDTKQILKIDPADANYDPLLRNKINEEIQKARYNLIKTHPALAEKYINNFVATEIDKYIPPLPTLFASIKNHLNGQPLEKKFEIINTIKTNLSINNIMNTLDNTWHTIGDCISIIEKASDPYGYFKATVGAEISSTLKKLGLTDMPESMINKLGQQMAEQAFYKHLLGDKVVQLMDSNTFINAESKSTQGSNFFGNLKNDSYKKIKEIQQILSVITSENNVESKEKLKMLFNELNIKFDTKKSHDPLEEIVQHHVANNPSLSRILHRD